MNVRHNDHIVHTACRQAWSVPVDLRRPVRDRLVLVRRMARRRRPANAALHGPMRGSLVGIAGILLLALGASAGYVVQPGDTLTGIAREFGTTVTALVDANGIADANRIYAGQQLELPGDAAATPPAPPAAPTETTPSPTGTDTVHTVRPGENLWRIAARYGATREAIAVANGLTNPHHILVGQRLTIPAPANAAPAAPTDADDADAGADEAGAGEAPAAPAPATPAPAAPGRAEVERLLVEVAGEYGWNPAWIKALAWQESGWQQHVRSSAGAVGIMQVMPATGQFVARSIVGRPLDLSDPRDNVVAGVAFLDYLLELTGGDIDQALAGYYQGLGSVSRNGMYASTVQYVRNVKALKARFG